MRYAPAVPNPHLRGRSSKAGSGAHQTFDGSLSANLRHSETKASDDELCGCGDKRRREVWLSPRAAAVRAELRSASSRSEHESTSVRSRRYGSGHPIRVFPHTGRTFSWLQASLRAAKSAPGRLDCTAGGGDRGRLREQQRLARLLEHCECLPDGEHDGMIRPHATTFLSRRCLAAFTRWSRASGRCVQRICGKSGFIARGTVSIVFRAATVGRSSGSPRPLSKARQRISRLSFCFMLRPRRADLERQRRSHLRELSVMSSRTGGENACRCRRWIMSACSI
jgi:hypothetical protein